LETFIYIRSATLRTQISRSICDFTHYSANLPTYTHPLLKPSLFSHFRKSHDQYATNFTRYCNFAHYSANLPTYTHPLLKPSLFSHSADYITTYGGGGGGGGGDAALYASAYGPQDHPHYRGMHIAGRHVRHSVTRGLGHGHTPLFDEPSHAPSTLSKSAALSTTSTALRGTTTATTGLRLGDTRLSAVLASAEAAAASASPSSASSASQSARCAAESSNGGDSVIANELDAIDRLLAEAPVTTTTITTPTAQSTSSLSSTMPLNSMTSTSTTVLPGGPRRRAVTARQTKVGIIALASVNRARCCQSLLALRLPSLPNNRSRFIPSFPSLHQPLTADNDAAGAGVGRSNEWWTGYATYGEVGHLLAALTNGVGQRFEGEGGVGARANAVRTTLRRPSRRRWCWWRRRR
jgi:hypothetical protein